LEGDETYDGWGDFKTHSEDNEYTKEQFMEKFFNGIELEKLQELANKYLPEYYV